MSVTEEKQRQWCEITNFLAGWYHKPEIKTLKTVLCQYVSHTCIQDEPVWLFVLGPPSRGKSTQIIRALSFLPDVHELGIIGPNSFLSGYGTDTGVLRRLRDGNGVLVFNDFSSFLSLRPEYRMELQGQLRSIFDGRLVKPVGNKNKSLEWTGKVTVVAACTPELERHWGIAHSLGERFLYTKFGSFDAQEAESAIDKAKVQIGNEEHIHTNYRDLILNYVDVDTLDSSYIDVTNEYHTLSSLAMLTALFRAQVHRDVFFKQSIVAVDEPENPTRIYKAMLSLARASAMLERRKYLAEDDLTISRRVAIDSVPTTRAKILKALLLAPAYTLTRYVIKMKTGIPRTSVRRIVEDMQEQELVSVVLEHEGLDESYIVTLSPSVVELAFRAGIVRRSA